MSKKGLQFSTINSIRQNNKKTFNKNVNLKINIYGVKKPSLLFSQVLYVLIKHFYTMFNPLLERRA